MDDIWDMQGVPNVISWLLDSRMFPWLAMTATLHVLLRQVKRGGGDEQVCGLTNLALKGTWIVDFCYKLNRFANFENKRKWQRNPTGPWTLQIFWNVTLSGNISRISQPLSQVL